MCCVNNRNVLKISLSNADAEDRKFEVMMTSLPLTLSKLHAKIITFSIHFCLMFIKSFKFFFNIKTSTNLNKIYSSCLVNTTTSHEAVLQ